MTEAQQAWREMQAERQADYRALLDRIDRERVGVKVVCPGCKEVSWIKLPEKSDWYRGDTICCPRACGMFGSLLDFAVVSCEQRKAGSFDTVMVCGRDGSEFATNGVVVRCPVCSIENARQVMVERKRVVLAKLGKSGSVNECADGVASLMSAFDGVMRVQNSIAIKNVTYMNKEPRIGEFIGEHGGVPGSDGPGEVFHPFVKSFQDMSSARDQILKAGWDMASAVSDWPRFLMIGQKRHLFAHALGVADEKYRAKSGDMETPLGKRVSLSVDDVVFFGDSSQAIVEGYFGMFLS